MPSSADVALPLAGWGTGGAILLPSSPLVTRPPWLLHQVCHEQLNHDTFSHRKGSGRASERLHHNVLVTPTRSATEQASSSMTIMSSVEPGCSTEP